MTYDTSGVSRKERRGHWIAAMLVESAIPRKRDSMTTIHTSPAAHLRRLAFGVMGAVALMLMIGAASAQARTWEISEAGINGGPIPVQYVREGAAATYDFTLRCSDTKQCEYRILPQAGTALANGKPGTTDYNAFAYLTRTFGRNKKWNVRNFSVKALQDTACEADEYFYVKVAGVFTYVRLNGSEGTRERSFLAKVVIEDDDCPVKETPPAPVTPDNVTPAPVTPAPGDTNAQQVTTSAGGATITTCTTENQTGYLKSDTWGQYIPGCTVRMSCPVATAVCTASSESGVYTERYIGHRVTLNSRLRVFSASGKNYWLRDVSCDSSDWCRTEDMVKIRGGESASVQCNGVRVNGPEANRARVKCSVKLDNQ